jgi:hypothetical protein
MTTYDTTAYQQSLRVAEYERVIAAGGSEEAAQNASATVGSEAGTRALSSFNLNEPTQTTTEYGPRGTVPPVRYRESEFTALYGAPGDRTSPAASTYLGGAESTQGATAYPVVDYNDPQFQSIEQIDAEILAEKRLAGDI